MIQDHYFSKDPKTGHQIQSFQVELLGQKLKFWTDAGVFSKRKLDRGSKLLLESIDPNFAHKILDLGCGYGPIGITLAKLAPQAQIYMSDVNSRAVELSKRNAQENRVFNTEVRQGDGFQPFWGEQFDLIVTNPPVRAGKEVIYDFFAQAKEHLTPSGSLVLVIRTQQGAKSAQRKLEELYPKVLETERGGGFRVFRCWKNNPEK